MKSVLLIGMGKFGQTLGEKLVAMGDEVMIVDKNEDIVNRLAPKYADALIANCLNAETLKALDIPSFDVCIVAIGEDFQASLEITSLLKELGAKYVLSKAATEIQRKFLLRNGANEVVYPDGDLAEKIAVRLNANKVFDYIELNSDYSIFEIEVPSDWIGKKIIEANPRKKFGLNILAIEKTDNTMLPSPDAEYLFEAGDHIFVFGHKETVLKFSKKKNK